MSPSLGAAYVCVRPHLYHCRVWPWSANVGCCRSPTAQGSCCHAVPCTRSVASTIKHLQEALNQWQCGVCQPRGLVGDHISPRSQEPQLFPAGADDAGADGDQKVSGSPAPQQGPGTAAFAKPGFECYIENPPSSDGDLSSLSRTWEHATPGTLHPSVLPLPAEGLRMGFLHCPLSTGSYPEQHFPSSRINPGCWPYIPGCSINTAITVNNCFLLSSLKTFPRAERGSGSCAP